MRHTRSLVAATAVALALGGVSACSAAKQAAAGAAAPLVSVADAMSLTTKATQQYSSVHVKLDEQISAQGQNVDVNGAGALGWKPLAMDMTMTMNNAQLAQAGLGSIHMMMSGTTMYMNMGDQGAAKLGGKHWMKMDLAALGAQGKALSDQMNKASGQDPATQVKLLTQSGDIKRVGTETVDGVQTTHYSGTVDMSKIAAQGDANLKSLMDQSSKLGITGMNVDLWVNAQNLPVRVQESTPSSATTSMKVSIDYTDYSSSPVTITPPPASDTTDMSSMLNGKL